MQIGDEVLFNTAAGPEPRAIIKGYIQDLRCEPSDIILNITIQIALNDELHTIDIDRTRLMPDNRVSIRDLLNAGYAGVVNAA